MAINAQKLLPQSKLTTAERMAASYDKRVDDVLNFKIKEKLINVDKFFKKETKEKVKKAKKEKVKKERAKREEKEKDLETPKGIKGIDKVKSLFPKTGILDAIQRFATFTFLGYLLTKFEDNLPAIAKIDKNNPQIGKVSGDIFTGILNSLEGFIGGATLGTVNSIEAAYDAYDNVRGTIQKYGGPNATKKFDELSSGLNKLLNATIILAILYSKRLKEPPKGPKGPSGPCVCPPTGLAPAPIRSTIPQRKPAFDLGKLLGTTLETANISASVALAFLTAAGYSLKDLVLGGAKNGGLIVGYARGGQATRGGKVVGGAVGRTFRAQRIQTPKKVQPERVNPGKDVGGKLKIEKLYPNPKPDGKKRVPNPYKALTGVSDSLDKGGWIGALMAAGVKLALGQKVDSKKIAASVASGVGSLSQASDQGLGTVSRSILGMADGGIIPSLGSNTQVVGNLLAILIQSRVNEALKSVTDELIKGGSDGGGGPRGPGGPAGPVGPTGPASPGGGSSSGLFEGKAADIPPEGKALLDAIAGSESSGYNSRYPSKTFSGYGDHPRLDEIILSGPNKGLTSNAAGRYQFISTTWDDYKPGKAFTPENQDIAAYRLAIAAYGYGEKGLIEALRKDPLAVANKLSGTWTSLPGGFEPNDATNGFLSRFQASIKKYKKPKQKVSTVFKIPAKETGSQTGLSPIFQYPTPGSTTLPGIEKSRPQKVSSLSQYPSYDSASGSMMVAIQPIIIEKTVPMASGGGSQTIAFPVPVGVNNNMASLSR